MKWFKQLFQKKNFAGQSTFFLGIRPDHINRDYRTLSEEGYAKNSIGYASINRVAEAVADIPLVLKKKTNGKTDPEVDNHPILDLLKMPNPIQSYKAFTKSAFGYLLLSGDNFTKAIIVDSIRDGKQVELWNLMPNTIEVIKGKTSMIPKGYIFRPHHDVKEFYEVDPLTGESQIMHLKLFNPTNPWCGLSPISAAAYSFEQHNQIGVWNLGILQNSGRPSGALKVSMSDKNIDGMLTETQRELLRKEITMQHAGAINSGKIMVLEGGMEWQEMGFNPKDMDFINSKHVNAREISLVFGVPPQLLGIPGDSTYSNYKEAKVAFYTDTVIPNGKLWIEHLNNWLVKKIDPTVYLSCDIDSIEALEPLREAKWTQVQGADFLTINEKRDRLGYGKYESPKDPAKAPADVLFVRLGMSPLEEMFIEVDDEETDIDEEDDGNSDDDSSDSDDGADSEDDDERSHIVAIEGKAVEVRTQRQKEKFRRGVVARRNRLSKGFAKDIKQHWKSEALALGEALENQPSDKWDQIALAEIDKHQNGMRVIMANHIITAMKLFSEDILSIGKELGAKFETKDAQSRFDSFLQNYIENSSGERIQGIYGTTKKQILKKLRGILKDSIDAGETPNVTIKQVEGIYGDFSIGRSANIVRTEMAVAQNEAHRAAADAIGVPDLEKTWISELADRSRENHKRMHDVSVPLKEKFQVEGDSGIVMMNGPGDPSAPPGEIINCHCVLVFGRPK